MSRVELRAVHYENVLGVALEMLVDGAAVGHAYYSASEFEALICAMGEARAKLIEMVPDTLEPGARIPTVDNPSWSVRETATGPVLALRHPGLGWLGFSLPGQAARDVAEALKGAARDGDHPSGSPQ